MRADWFEETHSPGFELGRHFFLRFFASDLVSSPGQWVTVVTGIVAVLLSLGALYVPGYYKKYLVLGGLSTPRPYRLAMLADILSLIVLAMALIGILTVIQWHSLFPGLRDYLVLASLPVRMCDIFVAKFAALLAYAMVIAAATNVPQSVLLPAVFAGKYSGNTGPQIPALFVSSTVAALFVFFCLVALQGVLLNTIPLRYFGRVSLAIQGALLAALLGGLPMAFSLLTPAAIGRPPRWAVWLPPVWFLGLDRVLAGSADPLAARLARVALGAVAVGACAAVATYWWGYRRHRVRVIEATAKPDGAEPASWRAALAERSIRDPPEMAVFAFTAKTLARSPLQRLVLTAFVALAAALIGNSFADLFLGHGFSRSPSAMQAYRHAAIAAPLALSLFVLSGLRYLFRLPVALRANWIFRVHEAGNRLPFRAATARFLLYCGVAPAALATLPVEIRLLGFAPGIASAAICLLASLILMEAFLMQTRGIPFTSSYLPGRRPVIQTLLAYGLAVTLYVTALASIVDWSLSDARKSAALFAALLVIWVKLRWSRGERMQTGSLEFEELPEPAVFALGLKRE